MTTSTHTGTTLGSGSTDNDGGVIMGAGSVTAKADGGRFSDKSVLDIVSNDSHYGARIAVRAGTAYEPGVNVARTAGSPAIAFTPDRGDRSSTNSTFLIRGVGTKLSNITSSEDVMRLLGGTHAIRSVHYHSENYYQRGAWASLAFNLFRNPTAGSTSNHGFTESDFTDKTGLATRGVAAIFRNIADQDNALPVANIPTRAIPGEVVFLIDFVTRSTSGGNFQDYSAITGG